MNKNTSSNFIEIVTKLLDQTHSKVKNFGKASYYHIITVVTYSRKLLMKLVPGHKFGAAGLSRRSTLMDKPLEFNSLFDLIKNYDEAYKDCGHRLVKVG